MGNSCSSGQSHKDKDNMSQRSEESGSYQVRASLSTEKQQVLLNHVSQQQHSGVLLEPSSAGKAPLEEPPKTLPTATVTSEKKTVLSKALHESMSLSSPVGSHSLGDFDSAQLPEEVAKLSEQMQNLLLGRVLQQKTSIKTQKIVIYICAADSQDCCVEKGAFHNILYPDLRSYCRSRDYELHIVDLHWKTLLEKQQDHEFPELCIGELTRHLEVAYVIPVIFLNNSLGTPLLPNTIECVDFKVAVDSAESETAQSLLNKWYRLDSEAQPPCYRLQPVSCHITGFRETSSQEKEAALEEWKTEIEKLLEVLVNVFPLELRDSYLTTVVEQEVHNTVFMSQELAKRCIWVNRVFTPSEKTPENPTCGEKELERRLNNLQKDLREQLAEKHIIRTLVKNMDKGLNLEVAEHKQYIDQIITSLKKYLIETINNIIEEHKSKTVVRPSYGIDSELFEELNQQTIFCQKAAQCSINREKTINEIKSYITSDNASPLVVLGTSGCGKSTLIARVAQCCQQWLPEAFLIIRFVGISAQSSTIEQILYSITNQCSFLIHGHKCYCRHNIETYSKVLPDLLTSGHYQRPIIIILDGIDQVKPFGLKTIEWLPKELPGNIKLVLSVTEGSDIHNSMKSKFSESCFVKMAMLGEKEAKDILMSSVMQYNHSVDSKVQDCVLKSVNECTHPLYAKVLAWQTSWWVDDEHTIVPKGDVTAQLSQMLEELENILGLEQVQHALALMISTKHGITDSEMIDLLAFDETFHSDATYVVWAPGCLTWSRLNKHLAPFIQWTLTSGMLGIEFRDSTFCEAVKCRYKDNSHWAHNMLYDYYNGKWWSSQEEKFKARLMSQDTVLGKCCYNKRKTNELPYQFYCLDKMSFCKSTYLTDLSWIYTKICASGPCQMLEDLFICENAQDKYIEILREFLEENTVFLKYDGRQFYPQLYCFLKMKIAKKQLQISSEIKLSEIFERTKTPPVLSLVPLDVDTSEDELNMGTINFNLILRLPGTDSFIVSVSTERDEICVWDVVRGIKVRTLSGINHPSNLIPIDQYNCVALCKRELKIYNLDTGSFVKKLKGVMNQKMPYYGLHDQSHLVALSRNRMYVNLMNLESGDCVTTFKAGEDRFLNSLLVSGDGRILVCGDETQKPFPLLVWNLKSKKLMYDLRIPHHDFITSLSAITYEGNYVCCVCHEIDEPNPNFIVVYDLQSGTLFKKWKPSCSTVALEISSPGGCVISGLEDARILVWDLITGNCRWSLCGHTAPVSSLRLDPTGFFCLSSDVKCRDRSIRIWDLNKGDLVAVYTPQNSINACEIMSRGRIVVLALEGFPTLQMLHLRGPGVQHADDNYVYGNPENNFKVFNVDESENC
ncbi:NACHT domain- and WD repeat-containing protein 1 isoform X2 [Agrilus planipennis]|uniref:NACHT domain- and WD repeat-containing protein 1 isoform X2 n=1 Tax=Agrilus planipennis TaxID=224129 RepID=A0A1W4W6Q0_AGRPL|nr:NACHT domain- and WD repeat-containing protein 1 isoform X2 [Agrilus planipennis]